MALLTGDRLFECKSIVVEDKNTKEKKYYYEGITIQCDIVNQNGRSYPIDLISESLKRYLNKFKLGKNTYGVLNHPGVTAEDADYVNPKEVSHLFVDIYRDGKNFITKSLVMDTPNGKIVKAFIDAGAMLGISTRGNGDFTIRESDNVQMITEYDFVTLGDYVTDPSAPQAYLNAILERRDWINQVAELKGDERSKRVQQFNDKVYNTLKSESVKEANKKVIKFFNEYFNMLIK